MNLDLVLLQDYILKLEELVVPGIPG